MTSLLSRTYQSSKKILLNIILAVLGLICATVLCLGLVLSIPVYISRWIIIQLAKYIRPDLGPPLNPLSVMMVRDRLQSSVAKPPRSNMVNIAPLDGPLEVALFQKLVLEKWIHAKEPNGELKYPQFSQYPVSWLGTMFWAKDKHFDIKNHIYSHPQGGDKELNELAEELLNGTHHPTRSSWEFHILQDYNNPELCSGKMSVLLLKFHHSLCDGYSILNAMGDLYGQTEFKWPKFRTPKRSLRERIGYSLRVPFTGMIQLAQNLPGCSKDNPWKIPDGEKAWHQYYARSELIPNQQIKQIKDKFGVSFTSVLLSAISVGIHKNLEGKRLNKTLRCDDKGGSLNCLSILPLPPNGRVGRLTNHATGGLFGIPTRSFLNSLERLRECHRLMEATKNSLAPAIFATYLNALGSHVRPVQTFFIKNQTVSTGLTNFPTVGKDFNGTVLGRKPLASHTATGGMEGDSGCVFTVVSFRDNIRVAVVAEKGLLSSAEVDAVVKHLEDEIHVLYSLSNGNSDGDKTLNERNEQGTGSDHLMGEL